MARQVRIEILGDAKSVGRAFAEASNHAGRFGNTMGKVRTGVAASFAAIGVGGALAGVAVGRFVADSVKGFQEHQKVVAQTTAVIKSTGGAAKASVTQINALSDALERKTTVDGDLIQSGANMLLTFTNVRNEVGRGNDIFNRATATVVDMSVALGQDTKSSAIQLGKALNDPIRGVTALQRVGVTFTTQQKDQIKTLVEHGHRLEAQKIILAELGKEFGGSAAAQATAWGKLSVIYRQVQDLIGAALLPLVNKLADWVGARLPGAIAKATRFFGLLGNGLSALGAAFREGDVTSGGFVGAMERIGVAARTVVAVARTVIAGIKALGAAFREGDVTSGGFVGAMERIGVFARALWPRLVEIARVIRDALGDALRSVMPGLRSLMDGAQRMAPVVKVLAAVWAAWVYFMYTKVIPVILRVAGPVLGFLLNATGKWIGVMAGVIRWIGSVVAALLRFTSGARTTGEAMHRWGTALSRVFTGVGEGAQRMWDHVLKPVFRLMVGGWLNAVGAILRAAALAFGWVPGVGGKLRTASDEFGKFRDRTNRALDGIGDESVTVTGKIGWQGLRIFKTASGRGMFAAGGRITQGSSGTADDVPIWASRGEYVVNAKAAARNLGLLEAVNAGGRFARGGLIPRAVTPSTATITRGPRAIQGQAHAIAARLGDVLAARLKAFVNQGLGGPGIQRALSWARGQQGKPYIWGGVGPRGYDCSGFMSALTNVIMGRNPYRRLFATGSFPPAGGWARGLVRQGFSIGYFRGSPGHMAGTLGGVNVESRGSRGVVVGAGARGAGSPLFGGRIWHLMGRSGARGGQEAPPGLAPQAFDGGGWLPPGLSLAYNGTGRPEPVLPPGQTGTVTVARGAVQLNVYGAQGQSVERLAELVDERLQSGLGQVLDIVRARLA